MGTLFLENTYAPDLPFTARSELVSKDLNILADWDQDEIWESS